MKHRERRKEIGKMFVDVAKYLITAVFVGRLFTEGLTFKMGIFALVAVAIIILIGFYTIPPEKEEE
ncbi:MAG: hypothetical protein QMD07_04205 [Thermodesulfovibrionales bacterium]|nr:hypothetical protein [Thermodesulfovibrionales bacterium]